MKGKTKSTVLVLLGGLVLVVLSIFLWRRHILIEDLRRFESVRIGMARPEVAAILGKPSYFEEKPFRMLASRETELAQTAELFYSHNRVHGLIVAYDKDGRVVGTGSLLGGYD